MWMSARQSCQKMAEHTTWDLTVPHLLVPGLSPAAFQNSLVLLKEEEEKEEVIYFFACVSLNNVTCYLQS